MTKTRVTEMRMKRKRKMKIIKGRMMSMSIMRKKTTMTRRTT